MSSDLNSVSLVGRVTRDPELRYTSGGTAVLNLSLAVNESIRQADGTYQEVPHFFDIQYWGKAAEGVRPHISKGRQLAIQGKLKFQSWEDRDSGQKRSKVVITAMYLQLLSIPGGVSQAHTGTLRPEPTQQTLSGADTSTGEFAGPESFDDDLDIPF